MALGEILVIIVFVALPLLIIVSVALRVNAAHRGGNAGEARAIQEIHESLQRMEDRMDQLETIVLARQPDGPDKDEPAS